MDRRALLTSIAGFVLGILSLSGSMMVVGPLTREERCVALGSGTMANSPIHISGTEFSDMLASGWVVDRTFSNLYCMSRFRLQVR